MLSACGQQLPEYGQSEEWSIQLSGTGVSSKCPGTFLENHNLAVTIKAPLRLLLGKYLVSHRAQSFKGSGKFSGEESAQAVDPTLRNDACSLVASQSDAAADLQITFADSSESVPSQIRINSTAALIHGRALVNGLAQDTESKELVLVITEFTSASLIKGTWSAPGIGGTNAQGTFTMMPGFPVRALSTYR
jgi:hypothetical protein